MKMKQPELGKKIADLRKAQGLTQEELVERCNLSVRTLQRIESGEVEPRSHTIRVIFAALDYKVYDSSNIRFRLFFKQVGDLFNLRTNTMRKLSILTLASAATIFVLLTVCIDGNAQSEKKVTRLITDSNKNFIRWFNSGQVDSLMTIYRNDACLVGDGCGKAYIRDFYGSQMHVYKFEEMNVISISVADSIAVEKGRWAVRLNSGGMLHGEYLTEWRRRDKKWQIVNDISVAD
jgi:transcriptional regulator with XRE-family HTH domain